MPSSTINLTQTGPPLNYVSSTAHTGFLNTSKDDDSIISLFQYLTVLSENKFSLRFNLKLSWYNLSYFFFLYPLLLSFCQRRRSNWSSRTCLSHTHAGWAGAHGWDKDWEGSLNASTAFLQVIEEPTRGAILDLVLTSREELGGIFCSRVAVAARV